MSNTQQNRFAEKIIASTGTEAAILGATNYPNSAGELAFSTDTQELYIGTDPTTGGSFMKVTRLKGYTVATLPTGVLGDMAYVTDATAPAYLTAVTGGGAVTCPVFFDGTNWIT